MVQQYMEQALLAAILAVRQGLIAPDRAAEILAKVLASPERGWMELVIEQRFLEGADADALQSLVDQQLEQHAGDVTQTLTTCDIDSQLQVALERIDNAELKATLRQAGLDGAASQSDANTLLGDRYATLGSEIQKAPANRQDPYITGALSSSPLNAAQPDGSIFSATGASAVSGTSPIVDSHAAAALAGNSPTEPDQRVLPSESVLNVHAPPAHETQSSAPPDFQTLNQATQQPDGEYNTLKSGVSNTGQSPADSLNEQDSIPWPLRFRVLREHAKGGLGKVSVAEDLELHREVAFKEIQRNYADDEEARTRFLLEAEITGGLEHPGIVPVYGLGTHADGRPYYAMRFIRGRSLQQAIDHFFRNTKDGIDAGTQQMEFRQLLRRFIDVCNAIDYAHNRGILHRDLKPSNVMLGDYGETLVVDWGLAKSVSVTGSLFRNSLEPLQPKYSGDASQTMMGVAIGTPQFMSPEQARGMLDELGPASDVYSLGATLYCLLTGVAAFTSRDLSTVMKNVKHGIFPSPVQVNPRIPHPLNAICLKAMALVPALRYGSSRALAEDIEHWLADEPVVAYPESRWERVSRWVRRHQARAQAIGATVIVVAVVSTVAAFLIDQSRRAEATALANLTIANKKEIEAHEKEKLAKLEAMRRSRDTREAIDTWLDGMSDALDDFSGLRAIQDVRKRLLERAAKDYTHLAEEKSTDPDLQLEAARSLVRLGDVYTLLNSVEKARQAFQRAETILARPPNDQAIRALYQLEQAVAKTRHGVLEIQTKDRTKAAIYFGEAVSLLKQLSGDLPNNLKIQIALGRALIGLGITEQSRGKLNEAGKHLQEAQLLLLTLRQKHSADAEVLTTAADAETNYARYLFDAAEPADAIRVYDRAIAIHDELVNVFPNDAKYLAQLATARISLADAQRYLGEWAKVVGNDLSSVDDLNNVIKVRGDVPRQKQNLAVARANLGQSSRKLGNNTAAAAALQGALADFTDLADRYPEISYLDYLAKTRTSLAQVQSELGQQDAALESVNTAIAEYRLLISEQDDPAEYQEELGIALRQLGRILTRRGDVAGGVQAFDESIKSLKIAAEKHSKVARIKDHLAWSWANLGQVQFAANKTTEARDAFDTALKIRQKLVETHEAVPLYRDTLAWQLATCPSEDLRDLKQALALTQFTTRSFPDSTQFWLTHGVTLLMLGKDREALTALEKSATLRGPNTKEALTLCLLAITEARLKHPAEAQKHLNAAKESQQIQKPADEELTYWMKQAELALGMK